MDAGTPRQLRKGKGKIQIALQSCIVEAYIRNSLSMHQEQDRGLTDIGFINFCSGEKMRHNLNYDVEGQFIH